MTIKSLKIQGKLEPKYLGVFKVTKISDKGNYLLKNEKGIPLKQSIPQSRLKVIPTDMFDGEQTRVF